MNKTRTLNEIDAEIMDVKQQLENVHGSATEVYARIVGYYRSVKNWNKGKKDEFYLRKMFRFLEDSIKKEEAEKNNSISSYEIYTRETCPNCPPVKEFMKGIDLPAVPINIDSEEGLQLAAKNGVFAAPTVIFYNDDKKEVNRCHSIEELKEVFLTL
ncbi:MAG: hypothetical protein MJ185_02815 [Treponema sp.]|nr:hypothetical protein [Treponema sp.]